MAKQREKAFYKSRAGKPHPLCNICGNPIVTGPDADIHNGERWHESHFPTPKAIGGKATGVAHEACNLRRAREVEAAIIAKVKRLEEPRRSKRPLPCGRHTSKFSKTVGGRVVLRLTLAEKLEATRRMREVGA
jgi:hypothetical protein